MTGIAFIDRIFIDKSVGQTTLNILKPRQDMVKYGSALRFLAVTDSITSHKSLRQVGPQNFSESERVFLRLVG